MCGYFHMQIDISYTINITPTFALLTKKSFAYKAALHATGNIPLHFVILFSRFFWGAGFIVENLSWEQGLMNTVYFIFI